MVYENCKKYGPYKSKQDGRWRLCIRWPDGRLQTISYPKYIVELQFGKQLELNEVVHHLDGDIDNNNFENLQVMDRADHSRLEGTYNPKEKMMAKCVMCAKEFEMTRRQYLKRQIKSKFSSGPYCSKSCAGKYGSKGSRKNEHQR